MFWRSKWVDACHSKLGIVMFHVINHLDPGWLRPGWGHFANCRCNKSHVVALAKQNREESRTSSGGFSWSTSHSFRIDQSTQIKIGDISLTYPHLYIHIYLIISLILNFNGIIPLPMAWSQGPYVAHAWELPWRHVDHCRLTSLWINHIFGVHPSL